MPGTLKPEADPNPFEPFRVYDELNRYPHMHPETTLYRDHIYLILVSNRGEISIGLPRTHHAQLKFGFEQIPDDDWVQLTDYDGSLLPIMVRRDPAGIRAKWLHISSSDPRNWKYTP